ncbi:hypothetical protein SAMN05216486_1105 [bacterium JGI 053]|nr:hypothetical protein SAMN05216486_1105 [bacterium JGI 053]
MGTRCQPSAGVAPVLRACDAARSTGAPFLRSTRGMNSRLSIIVPWLAAPLLAAGAAAQQAPRAGLPQLAQELFLAETVYPQEQGEVQLTLYSRVNAGSHTRVLAEYGVTDRLQLQLVTPALERGAAGDEEGAYDAGVLYALLPFARPLALSMSLEASFAHGAAPQWEPAVIAARAWGRVQLHGTAAAELAGGEAEPWGALAGLVDAGRATPTLELVRSADHQDYVVPGLFVHRDGAELGVAVPVCLSCDQRIEGFRAMLTIEF